MQHTICRRTIEFLIVIVAMRPFIIRNLMRMKLLGSGIVVKAYELPENETANENEFNRFVHFT